LPATVFLITPPFTQLNTPYPATAYLKGFLNTKNISCFQADLGIEVTLALFSEKGLTQVFDAAAAYTGELSPNARRIMALRQQYIQKIDATVRFLQGKAPTLAQAIGGRHFLPEASRFGQLHDLDWAFGALGIQDRAKHLATLFLEDIADFIKETVDEHFGFSRYAEKLSRSANSYDELWDHLQKPPTYIDKLLFESLSMRMAEVQPQIVGLSVPFPGNLYSALRCGQWIRQHYPGVKLVMGGGFPNTELRSLSDVRVFEAVDFITLDDGESPVEQLVKYTEGKIAVHELKRTFALVNGAVTYINNTSCKDYKQGEAGTPDYSDLLLDEYISAIEVINPMHRLWSDGRWNKLTMAHGCYWGKCTFCDISLDYIKVYEPIAASLLCDRMEALIAQTGETGFHFVDEAAPPALMRALALEIIRRRLTVSWWTNIRFEKSFTQDLCYLLKASGCIAVSGGLEVASDRLLDLIRKGVTVAQVAKVTQHFTKAGIMTHAYLMYGFPTQTAQETIDSLEIVRQLFEAGVLQSGFWHLFTMTTHSPVGAAPQEFRVSKVTDAMGSFANNDIERIDPTGTDHEAFSYGLKKSLLNYMHNTCFDKPLQSWFDFKTPRTTVAPRYIEQLLTEPELPSVKPTAKVVWLGGHPEAEFYTKSKKGAQWQMAALTFYHNNDTVKLNVSRAQGEWLITILPLLSVTMPKIYTYAEVQQHYEANSIEDDFVLFWYNKVIPVLNKYGLLVL
jgi:hypothetical protein